MSRRPSRRSSASSSGVPLADRLAVVVEHADHACRRARASMMARCRSRVATCRQVAHRDMRSRPSRPVGREASGIPNRSGTSSIIGMSIPSSPRPDHQGERYESSTGDQSLEFLFHKGQVSRRADGQTEPVIGNGARLRGSRTRSRRGAIFVGRGSNVERTAGRPARFMPQRRRAPSWCWRVMQRQPTPRSPRWKPLAGQSVESIERSAS